MSLKKHIGIIYLLISSFVMIFSFFLVNIDTIQAAKTISFGLSIKPIWITIVDNWTITYNTSYNEFSWIEIQITWSWNSLSWAYINYWTGPWNLDMHFNLTWDDSNMTWSMLWLKPWTTYYFEIIWYDTEWSRANSEVLTFTTEAKKSYRGSVWFYCDMYGDTHSIDDDKDIYEGDDIVLAIQSLKSIKTCFTKNTNRNLEVPYKDIWGHWAESYIKDLYSVGPLIKRIAYHPNENLRRSELIKIVLLTFWYKWELEFNEVTFEDVSKNLWYIPYLAKGIEEGVIDWTEYKMTNVNSIPSDLDLLFWDFDLSKISHLDTYYMNKTYEYINIQEILQLLGYQVKVTWEFDEQTLHAIKQYQAERMYKVDKWSLWRLTIEYLNNESVVKKAVNNNWAIRDKFRPSDSVNRAEAMKMILESSWLIVDWWKDVFPDVNSESWYSPYINFAAMKKIVSGYPDWYFRPWNNVTRWEIAKMVINTFNLLNNCPEY